MRAKAFFYVCGGLLCLALSYHLGARSATAQAGGSLDPFVGAWERGAFVARPNGDVYGMSATHGGWDYAGNIFGTEAAGRSIVQFDGNVALASSGEVFWSSVPSGPWTNLGVPPGQPTPTFRKSFGALKSRYRGDRESAQSAGER